MDRAEAIKVLNTSLYVDHDGQVFVGEGKRKAFHDALNMAIAALREQEQSKWISVKERLPEFGWYVCHTKSKYTGLFSVRTLCWNGKWWGTPDGASTIVTHWMELPEPPEGGADHDQS